MRRYIKALALLFSVVGTGHASALNPEAVSKYGYDCQADGTPGSRSWTECIERSDVRGYASCYQGPNVYGTCRPRGGSQAGTSRESANQKECGDIRAEIARQRSISAQSRQVAAQQDAAYRQSPAGVRLPSRDLEIQAAVAQNIAALETKSANLGCAGAFSGSPATSTPTPATGMSFDECFAKCKQLTKRSDTECFETCKR